jgi:hypothetical protein
MDKIGILIVAANIFEYGPNILSIHVFIKILSKTSIYFLHLANWKPKVIYNTSQCTVPFVSQTNLQDS